LIVKKKRTEGNKMGRKSRRVQHRQTLTWGAAPRGKTVLAVTAAVVLTPILWCVLAVAVWAVEAAHALQRNLQEEGWEEEGGVEGKEVRKETRSR
jgi:hypothetical protein